ncbi:hypothetical protein KXQ82_01345 [Mucilaginibacter sp. HMF5004]|nr:hypothetical protein [Mucilaginibacter rivuli]MBW4888334.1 hypothetical protein [Mucilaginibacter rivuli]
MQTQHITPLTNQPSKETWRKPTIEILSVNNETLGLGIDPDSIIHFFMGT